MAVTVRDLKLATQYESDFQRASETMRRVALANQGQLQAVPEAMFTVVAETARRWLQDAAQERALPRQALPSDSVPVQHTRLPIAQLLLHATFTVLMAFLVTAYMEAKLANEPEEW